MWLCIFHLRRQVNIKCLSRYPRKEKEENGAELDKRPRQTVQNSVSVAIWPTCKGDFTPRGSAQTSLLPQGKEGVIIPWAWFCKGTQRSNSLSLCSPLWNNRPHQSHLHLFRGPQEVYLIHNLCPPTLQTNREGSLLIHLLIFVDQTHEAIWRLLIPILVYQTHQT